MCRNRLGFFIIDGGLVEVAISGTIYIVAKNVTAEGIGGIAAGLAVEKVGVNKGKYTMTTNIENPEKSSVLAEEQLNQAPQEDAILPQIEEVTIAAPEVADLEQAVDEEDIQQEILEPIHTLDDPTLEQVAEEEEVQPELAEPVAAEDDLSLEQAVDEEEVQEEMAVLEETAVLASGVIVLQEAPKMAKKKSKKAKKAKKTKKPKKNKKSKKKQTKKDKKKKASKKGKSKKSKQSKGKKKKK